MERMGLIINERKRLIVNILFASSKVRTAKSGKNAKQEG